MKPAIALTVTDRYRLKELELKPAGTVTPGRIMWCRDRKILAFGDVADLANIFKIPKGANTVLVSMADFSDVREWLG